MLWLCFQNKGLYIKVGQYLSTLHHAIPHEYLQTLKARLPFDAHCIALHCTALSALCSHSTRPVLIQQVLQDHAPTMDYTIVQRIIEEDLGAKPEQLFREFDKIPLAAASLAQVAPTPFVSFAQKKVECR
jgi:aarF domain-containing kinase